jgi:hypothetical protein
MDVLWEPDLSAEEAAWRERARDLAQSACAPLAAVRVLEIYEGASEIQRMVIGQAVGAAVRQEQLATEAGRAPGGRSSGRRRAGWRARPLAGTAQTGA